MKEYAPGFLFKRQVAEEVSPENLADLGFLRTIIDLYLARGKHHWSFDTVRLKDYGKIGRLNFESYLTRLANKARREGRKLKILEIGISNAFQWKDFMNRHGDVVELSGTSLAGAPVHGVKLANFKLAHVGELLSHFQRGEFDVVIAHQTAYYQHYTCIENALLLARQGGHVFRGPARRDDASEIPKHEL